MRLKTATVLILATLVISAGVVPLVAEAASARTKPPKTPTVRQPTITSAALRAAAPLYQKNVAKLTSTRGSAQTPKPNVAPTPAGTQPVATPNNQPKGARTWSTTATTGQRGSVGNISTLSSTGSSASLPSARQGQGQAQ